MGLGRGLLFPCARIATALVYTAIVVGIGLLAGTGCDTERGPGPQLLESDQANRKSIFVADLTKLTFSDPRIECRYEWFESYADSVVGDNWHRRPYATFSTKPPVQYYYSERATFASDNKRSPANYIGPRPCHILNSGLRCSPHDRHRIEGMRIWASWNPPDTGWRVQIRYATSREPAAATKRIDETFSMNFCHWPLLAEPDLTSPNIGVDREGNADYQYFFHVDDVKYPIKVTTWDGGRSGRLRTKNPDAEIRRIMATPESFRDYSVNVYAQLARNVESTFADGSAIAQARLARMPHFNEDPNDLVSDRRLTAAEKQICHRKARADVQARIRILKTHYRAMYAAANHALPVLEMVSAHESPRPD